jgi:hypothetical protein
MSGVEVGSAAFVLRKTGTACAVPIFAWGWNNFLGLRDGLCRPETATGEARASEECPLRNVLEPEHASSGHF